MDDAARPVEPVEVEVSHSTHVAETQRVARRLAREIGFDETTSEEIVLAASELAANLLSHAQGGRLSFELMTAGGRRAMRVESLDDGPGLPGGDDAFADGFTSAGTLGYGLGTVNRLMDELQVTGRAGGHGTRIVAQRWLRPPVTVTAPCPLEFGAASCPYPGSPVNGDAFVVRQWAASAILSVIDGVGHGPAAHEAAESARWYLENHYDLPLSDLFAGVGRACRGGRGVVMAVARFDGLDAACSGSHETALTHASVGNIESRIHGTSANLIVRRGILGVNAPNPVVTTHCWPANAVLVMHSDGIKSHWDWDTFDVAGARASELAAALLRRLGRGDDATVLVAKPIQKP